MSQGTVFTINALYSEAGPLSVQARVVGTKSLRDAAVESGNLLLTRLRSLGMNVTLDIDATDICGTTVGMAGLQMMEKILDSDTPVSFIFHPRFSTPVSDLVRTNAQNELIAGESSSKGKGKRSPKPKTLELPSGASSSVPPEIAKMFENLQKQLNQQKGEIIDQKEEITQLKGEITKHKTEITRQNKELAQHKAKIEEQKERLDESEDRTERLELEVSREKRRTEELRTELGVVSAAAAGNKEAIARLRLRVLASQAMKILTHKYGELLEEDEGVASWASRVNFPQKDLIIDAVMRAKNLGNPIAHMATAAQIAEAMEFIPTERLAGFGVLFRLCFGVDWKDSSVQAGSARFRGPSNMKVKVRYDDDGEPPR